MPFLNKKNQAKDTRYKVVDPGESEGVQNFIKSNQIQVDGILITHKHWDHIGDIKLFYKGLKDFIGDDWKLALYAGIEDAVPGTTEKVGIDGKETTEDFGSWTCTFLPAPCHTKGHTLYYCESKEHADYNETTAPWNGHLEFTQSKVLFTGDTIFIGGCGRFFEGNPNPKIFS